MRREDWGRGYEYEGRGRGEFNRDFDGEDYGRGGYEGRGRGFRPEHEGRRGYERPFGGEYGSGFQGRPMSGGREFDEERGLGYGRAFGGGTQGHMGYGREFGGYGGGFNEPSYGQNWGGRFGGNYDLDRGHTPFGGRGFSGPRSDDEIEREIYDRLDHDWRIPDNVEIDVQVHEGIVTLNGNARNRNVKMAAWDCCWSVPGVEDVRNNITLTSRRREAQARTAGGNAEPMQGTGASQNRSNNINPPATAGRGRTNP